MDDQTPSTETYAALLASIKERIQTAQVRAAVAVNQELVLLYWGIGKEILARQQAEGWGSKVIDQLAKDLRRSFPGMRGLSPRNLKYMRALAEAWPNQAIVQVPLARLFKLRAAFTADKGKPLQIFSGLCPPHNPILPNSC